MTKMVALALMALTTAQAGPPQVDDWQRLVNLGSTAEASGEYGRAAAFYRDAARIAETFQPGDPRRPFTFNGLGMMYDALGQFADAELAYQRTLAVLTEFQPPPVLDRAMVLTNLSTLYLETGQTARAEKLLDEATAISAGAPDPDERRLAIVQNSLAELLISTGRQEEAERLLTACLAVLEPRPDAQTEVGIARNNLGVVRLYQGRFADSVRLLEQSLAALQAGRHPEHPIVLKTLNNLAAARQRNGQSVEAGRDWRHAVDLAAKLLGTEHPLYGEILANYARYLRETGDKSEGKALASRATRILRDSRRRSGIGAVIDVSDLRRKSK